MRVARALLLVGLAAACARERGVAARARDAGVEAGPGASLSLDGRQLARVDVDRAAGRVSLGQLVPEAAGWRTIAAHAGSRFMKVSVEDYRDHEICLYRDRRDRLTLGLFRRAGDGQRGVRAPVFALEAVERIEITTTAAEPSREEPSLELVRSSRTQRVGAQSLASLPSARWRTRERRKAEEPAWRLQDLVQLSGSLEGIERLDIFTGDGKTLTASGAAIGAILVKIDPHGRFQLKSLEEGGVTAWRARDVRRIAIIERGP